MNTDNPTEPEKVDAEQKTFHWRGLTSLTVTGAFLVLATTGVILYCTPQGRVANWTGWTFLGLEKEEWAAIHTTASILFVVSSLFHVYFNWRLLLNYIILKRRLHLKRELAGAFAIVIVVAAGTVLNIPPFSTIVAVNNQIKLYWERLHIQAPYPHAEDSTLRDFCDRTGLSPDAIAKQLGAAGVHVKDPNTETIRDLAFAHDMKPMELFSKMPAGSKTQGSGSGLGRYTVRILCEESGIPLENALETLRREGFDARADSTLKSLAEQSGRSPMQIKRLVEQTNK